MTRTTQGQPSKPGLLAVLLVAPFLAQADATIANVATPSIRSGLSASGAAVELVIGAYLIAFAALLITGARLGQRYGYRRILVLGIATFSAASVACGLAPSPGALIAARALQGAGAALMFPQTLTGIQLHFSGTERARAIGLYAAALSTGAVTGQILGGLLVSADLAGTEWRAIFLVNVPVGLAAIAAALRRLPRDDGRPGRRLDLPGVAAITAAVLLVVVPLSVGRAEGWPAWAFAGLIASPVALALFLMLERRAERRGKSPVVAPCVIARRPAAWGLLALTAATGTYYALLFVLAQYLQAGLGHSALVSGLTLVPWVAAFGVAGQIVRRLPERLNAAAPAAGCLLLAGAYAAISATLLAGRHGEGVLLPLLGLGGFGLGVQFSALLAHVTRAVPSTYAPDISGVSTTVMQIGGAVAVAALGTVYLSIAGGGDATHAFGVVTAIFAGVASVAATAASLSTRAAWGR